jgi:ABC-type thiamin/hydroxymethylpyrimidine transport system permease subunit
LFVKAIAHCAISMVLNMFRPGYKIFGMGWYILVATIDIINGFAGMIISKEIAHPALIEFFIPLFQTGFL